MHIITPQNETDLPNLYYVIIKSEPNESLDGIENFLENLTKEFDKLKTKSNLNIAFWSIFPDIPPPPRENSELKIPQGTFIYEIYFAEFGGRMANVECKVTINGNKISVEQTENTNLTGGKNIFSGLILKHKSGKWILSNNKNDKDADEIGGCTGIPIIEFDKKLIVWC
ncbi:MAG TPA: hypothetical protein VK021_04965 [Flavobacteriaceae bacterium]|nr:hypothetical protein [Flavobacteriaceae bacterium]